MLLILLAMPACVAFFLFLFLSFLIKNCNQISGNSFVQEVVCRDNGVKSYQNDMYSA